MLAFGPDGYLYIGTGDGGSAGDPENRAQNVNSLLGQDAPDRRQRVGRRAGTTSSRRRNPYVGRSRAATRSGSAACATRGGSRSTGSPATSGSATSGQDRYEEIDRAPQTTASGPGRGRNWGWRRHGGPPLLPALERLHHGGQDAADARVLALVHGRCAVTGGYVYRGTAIPALRRWYVFGDYCSGEASRGVVDRTDAGQGGPDPRQRVRPADQRLRSGRRAVSSTCATSTGPSTGSSPASPRAPAARRTGRVGPRSNERLARVRVAQREGRDVRRRGRPRGDPPRPVAGGDEQRVDPGDRPDQRAPVERERSRAAAEALGRRVADRRDVARALRPEPGLERARVAARPAGTSTPATSGPPRVHEAEPGGLVVVDQARRRRDPCAASVSAASRTCDGGPSSPSSTITPQNGRIGRHVPVGSTTSGVHGPAATTHGAGPDHAERGCDADRPAGLRDHGRRALRPRIVRAPRPGQRGERAGRGGRGDREPDVEADRGEVAGETRLQPPQGRGVDERRPELRVRHAHRRGAAPAATPRRSPSSRIPAGSSGRRKARSGRRGGELGRDLVGEGRDTGRATRGTAPRGSGSDGYQTTPELRPDAPAAIAARSSSVTRAPRPARLRRERRADDPAADDRDVGRRHARGHAGP